jgi:hypothetical protein
MDGKGRALDNIFILSRRNSYPEICLTI